MHAWGGPESLLIYARRGAMVRRSASLIPALLPEPCAAETLVDGTVAVVVTLDVDMLDSESYLKKQWGTWAYRHFFSFRDGDGDH